MRGFRIKPNLKVIDFKILKPQQLEFFCKKQVVDKMIMDKRKLPWDQTLADEMDQGDTQFFVVKTNMEYDIVFWSALSNFLKKHQLPEIMKRSEKADKCIQHLIKSLR